MIWIRCIVESTTIDFDAKLLNQEILIKNPFTVPDNIFNHPFECLSSC